jgi:hypothetical protein
MKKLLLITISALSFSAQAVTLEKVCHDIKGKQVCKMVKVHKPISDTTKVPDKKKK